MHTMHLTTLQEVFCVNSMVIAVCIKMLSTPLAVMKKELKGWVQRCYDIHMQTATVATTTTTKKKK
jgi:hypothetical protein